MQCVRWMDGWIDMTNVNQPTSLVPSSLETVSASSLQHAFRSKAVSVFSISLMPLVLVGGLIFMWQRHGRKAAEAERTFTAHSVSASIFLSLSADSSSVFAFKHSQRYSVHERPCLQEQTGIQTHDP